jgi:hypothetical protein
LISSIGSVATYLDLPRREQVFEVLSDTAARGQRAFLQSMLTFNDKLHVFTAPADMLPLDSSPEDINALLDMARANFDYVIVDMPSTIVQLDRNGAEPGACLFRAAGTGHAQRPERAAAGAGAEGRKPAA